MTYHVRAHETDTLNTTIDGPHQTHVSATARAEELADAYYGGSDVTWSSMDGPNRYLVGRILANGRRDGATCIMTIENDEDISEST